MIYEVYIFCPYEGVEENLILEHEKEFEEDEFEKIVTEAIIECSKKDWLKFIEEEPEEPYWQGEGHYKETFVGAISLNNGNYSISHVEDFLIKEYGFRKPKIMTLGFDTFTKVKDLIGAEQDCEIKQAEIQLMDKDAWKELGISNAEGRKAHITLETKELSRRVSEIKNEILESELKIKTLNRKLRLAMVELELSK